MANISSKEAFEAYAKRTEARLGYTRPAAYALGFATYSIKGEVLEVFYPTVNCGTNHLALAAFADAFETALPDAETTSIKVTARYIKRAMESFAPYLNDGGTHPNVEALDAARRFYASRKRSRSQAIVLTYIGSLDEPSKDVFDVYLRLHLLSHRLVELNSINLERIFGILPNVAWTSEGPIAADELPARQLAARIRGEYLHVHSLDKFPPMLDYVAPSGIRIADAIRVRLGARVGDGTTVMHEGFINVNAGTADKKDFDDGKGPVGCMIEGRISMNVSVGAGSDIGGGASLMGTLSGGGKIRVSVGERSLVGANGGIGIPLGNNVKIEAGLYVTADKLVWHEGSFVKPRTLAGISDVVFRYNSKDARIEVVPNQSVLQLNPALHDNN